MSSTMPTSSMQASSSARASHRFVVARFSTLAIAASTRLWRDWKSFDRCMATASHRMLGGSCCGRWEHDEESDFTQRSQRSQRSQRQRRSADSAGSLQDLNSDLFELLLSLCAL